MDVTDEVLRAATPGFRRVLSFGETSPPAFSIVAASMILALRGVEIASEGATTAGRSFGDDESFDAAAAAASNKKEAAPVTLEGPIGPGDGVAESFGITTVGADGEADT